MPKSPVTISIVDASGDLALTQKIFENYRQANPGIVSRFTFTKAPELELPGKIRAQQQANRVDIDLVLAGYDLLSTGLAQNLWIELLPAPPGSDHTGAGMATVLGHAIGARHGAYNGIVKAILLPHVLWFNASAAEAGLLKVATALDLPRSGGGSQADAVTGALEGLFQGLGIPRCLRDVGVPRDALPAVATHGMGDWFLRGNPRPVRDASDLQQVLEQAW